VLAAGCASQSVTLAPKNAAEPALAECRNFLETLDRTVSAHAVNDAESTRVEGYPFLRTNRFLASFPPGTLNADDFSEWLDRLQALDNDGRRVEVANLPPAARADLATRFAPAGHDSLLSLNDHVAHCERLLRSALVDTSDLRVELASRVTVPDDYRGWQRVIGLYPVTQIPFAVGVNAWQRETLRVFQTPLAALPQRGDLVRYQPPATARPSVTAGVEPWHADRLRIPEPPAADLQRLLLAHAPVLVIDTASADDRIGAIELDAAGRSGVAPSAPVVYTYPSYARWQGTILLQLNYVFWFPARLEERTWDLLAGHLDGITWRLTLAPDGTVLVADAIHNCGCYHLFFPSAGLRPVAYGAATEERPFTPQVLPALAPGERFALYIAARTHYLQRVTATPLAVHAAHTYALASYDTLRSLESGTGRRMSLFGPDGIVPGTERGERFLFWPMGVPDPGAMRQRGRHATAFVGRRHFDDPWLLERSFEPVSSSAIIRVPRRPPEQKRDDMP
jgi:hypothetical protein